MDSERVLPAEIHAVWPQTRYLPSKTRAAMAIDALAAEIPAMLGLALLVRSPAPQAITAEAGSTVAMKR